MHSRVKSVLGLAMGAVVAVATAGCGLDNLAASHQACTVTVDEHAVDLDVEQAANAATITAVGLRRDIGEQGVVVALATAWQESKLRNIDYGDRDSKGLFQQRPSQGWGDAEEIMDPRYSAEKFYERLEGIDGWQDMRVTDAAQAVQNSAYPEEYQKWVDDSAAMAAAFTGTADAGLSCATDSGEEPMQETSVSRLSESLLLDWGDDTIFSQAASDLSVPVDSPESGWQYALWLVAHSHSHGVSTVEFNGHIWDSAEGNWSKSKQTESGDSAAVVAKLS